MVAVKWLNIILMAALCVSSFIFGCFLEITLLAHKKTENYNFWIVISLLLSVSYLSANYVIVILIREYIKQKLSENTEEVFQNATETEEIERYIFTYSILLSTKYPK